MHPARARSRIIGKQGGFALFLGLIFLLMITLVAVTAMRGTSLELNMANNTANQELAFEGAESARIALIRAIREHVSCIYEWPSNVQFVGGGTACIIGCVLGDDANAVNYAWEPRLQMFPPSASLASPLAGENYQNPSTYVNRFRLQFGTGGTATVRVGILGTITSPGGGLAMSDGYNSAEGAVGSSSNYFEVASSGTLANTQANVAGIYRLVAREADSNFCQMNIAYN